MPDSDLRKQMVATSDALSEGAPMTGLPHCMALGMLLVESSPGMAVLRLPYSEEIIGDPETGVIGGGAITTLLDTCCGTAVISADKGLMSTATLDLRIDYMRPATAGMDVIAEARCYRVTKTVAFVQATAHHGDREKPIATAAASFIVNRKPEK